MIPRQLSSKLCGWLNIDLPDILNPRQNEGPVLTIKCSEKAFKRFLASYDNLVNTYVPVEERNRHLVEGWICEKLAEQIPVQPTTAQNANVVQSQTELDKYFKETQKRK